jgi:hypothetical protein
VFPGATRRKTKQVILITDSIFLPPSIDYNPFAQRHIACPEEKQMANRMVGALKAGPAHKQMERQAVQKFKQSAQHGAGQPGEASAEVSIHPLSDNSSLSDWTDYDEEEFDSLPVCNIVASCLLLQCLWATMLSVDGDT